YLRYVDNGTYTADLQDLGFQLTSSLKYTQLFIQVQKDAKGWSYMAFATPLHGKAPDGGWAVAQHADGKFQASLPGTLNAGGASACSVWRGWQSMEGGRIEGEESLSTWSSSTSGGPPCARNRVVFHGKRGSEQSNGSKPDREPANILHTRELRRRSSPRAFFFQAGSTIPL